LATQAQVAFVDGLGLAMVIAAGAVAAAALLVFWRAPSEVVTQRDVAPALARRVVQSPERG
jgi:hypothetical protein